MTNRSLLSFFLCIGILVAFTASGVADDDVAKAKKAKGDEKTPAEKVVKKKDASAEEKPGPEDARSKKRKGKAKADKKKPGNKKSGGEDSEKKPEPKTETPESKPADSEKPKPETPPTVEVKQERFAIEVELDGTFAAKKGTEIAIDPESWSAYVVLKAVEHGAKVKKGELLIACDTEEIDEALEDARRDFEIADLEFKRTTSEYELLKKLTPMELAEMKRSHAWAKEDEAYFWESQLPLEKEMIELSFEFSKFRLEYAKEELRQLEEMYGEDELTEETEEIILKRARKQVEAAEFMYRMEEAQYEREKSTLLPRTLQERKEGSKRRDMRYRLAEKLFPTAVKQRELVMAKAKIAHQKAKEKLDELIADRKLMTLKAPCDGIVYYGECVRGKWSSASSMASKLKPNGKLGSKAVLLTILGDGPMRVEADFTEKQLRDVREGIKGSVKPTAYPDMKLEGIVDEVIPLPSSGTSFHAALNLARHPEDALLHPGMTCQVELTSYEKEDALTLPPKAIKTDEETDKPYVYIVKDGAEPKRREIKTGRKTDKAVEILKGLSEGDKVLATPPNGDEEEKSEKPTAKTSAAKKPAEKKPTEKKATAEKAPKKKEAGKGDSPKKKPSPKNDSKES